MSVFKCKMCGGTIEFEPGATVGVCDSCGTKQTLPRLDDDRRANLYDRANHFRRNNEFDKAAGLYEQILTEDPTDAEAYWSLVLCRYGIEYVEDPKTRKRVPTVNRMQFTSIFDDDNYKSALEHADTLQKGIYEAEAAAINEIQKGSLAISRKEEPFDVFICYKETDANGRRTPDSVLANDLYHQLTQEGFKVFFARITLEDKLGTAYEPYIFAALNSAKVMVVLGTRPEYFNAVWVKNEWSRYLSLVKQSGGKKVLIPAYRDMDPYDLPEEFSHLQAQDMSKLGFMQDLIRGIKKIAQADEPKAAPEKETVAAGGEGNIEPLLKRAFMFLEDGNFMKANEYCERVLDQEPENAQAYLGKLMAELRVRKQEELANCEDPFDSSSNYQKAVRFGDEELSGALQEFNDCANENKRRAIIYTSAKAKMAEGGIKNYETAIKTFDRISGWKDVDEQIEVCRKKIREIRAKEAAERLEEERRAKEERAAAEKAARKQRKTITAILLVVLLAAAAYYLIPKVVLPEIAYRKAVALLQANQYEKAIEAFSEMDGYRDSEKKIKEAYQYRYAAAVALQIAGKNEEAVREYAALGSYKDSADKVKEIETLLFRNAQVGSSVYFGSYKQHYSTVNEKEIIEWLVLAKKGDKLLVISKYALDGQPYNTSDASVTWETSSLRKWLNGTFFDNAFSSDEQAMIQRTTVTADRNPSYSTSPGNNTTDKVFLLSIAEVNEYFSSDSARQCLPTASAGYLTLPGVETCTWWLRSPGDDSNHAAGVDYDGSLYYFEPVIYHNGVRPAIWINIG